MSGLGVAQQRGIVVFYDGILVGDNTVAVSDYENPTFIVAYPASSALKNRITTGGFANRGWHLETGILVFRGDAGQRLIRHMHDVDHGENEPDAEGAALLLSDPCPRAPIYFSRLADLGFPCEADPWADGVVPELCGAFGGAAPR